MAELPAIVIAFGHALLHFVWQGTVIGLCAALALRTLRDARPQVRYAVACLALLACVAAPLLTVLASMESIGFVAFSVNASTYVAGEPRTPGLAFLLAAPAAIAGSHMSWIVASWAGGTTVMCLRIATGLAWIRDLRKSPQGAERAVWQRRLDALARRFGLRRDVVLCVVESLDTPVSAGWWRPVVLLPAALIARMPVESIDALLAHELAHIRRHDYVVNLVQNAIEAVLFYHPVVWWLSRRIRVEREQIADQLAADVACTPRNLALALSELSDLHCSPTAFHLAQSARGGELMSRIERLVRPDRRVDRAARVVFPMLGLLAAGLATYSYAHIGPVAHAEEVSGVASGRDTYALVRRGSDDMMIWGPSDDTAAIAVARRVHDRDFLWVRRAGRDYIVTDPEVVERAARTWHTTDVLGREIDALDAQMGHQQQAMDALQQRFESMPADSDDRASREAMAELSREAAQANAAMAERSRRHEALSREREYSAEQAAEDIHQLVDEAFDRNLAASAPPRDAAP